MTELYATNLRNSVRECDQRFRQAMTAANASKIEHAWLELLRITEVAISEARNVQIEADALAAELLVYRPTRHDRPAAPPLAGYMYVFTAKFPWVCAAVEVRHTVHVVPDAGIIGYDQEHYVPERKTICGKKTTFPVSERFTSGGWPRLHELCPDCTVKLVEKGLITVLSAEEMADFGQGKGIVPPAKSCETGNCWT